MNNEWNVSKIFLQKGETYKRITLQHDPDGWCLKADESDYQTDYSKGSITDAAELASAILNGKIPQLAFVKSLTVEVYSHVNEERVRILFDAPFSEIQILEKLSKLVPVFVDSARELPFLWGSGMTAYEVANIVTAYLKGQVDEVNIYFRAGNCIGTTLKKGQSFEENLRELCDCISIHSYSD